MTRSNRTSFCKAHARFAAICALTAILFGSAVFGLEPGYVTVGTGPGEYTSFSDAYNVGGALETYTIHSGNVHAGSQISSGSAPTVDMTIKSDVSRTYRTIDLKTKQSPGFRFLVSGEDASIDTTLRLDSIQFSNGNPAENGGVIYSYSNLGIYGTAKFSDNQSGNSGGAIYAKDKVTFNTGEYLFDKNASQSHGGAIYATSVEFKSSGSSMITKFTGNTMSSGAAKNDIYATGSDGVTFNGEGSYSFDGGIQAQALTLSGGANVTFEAGSMTQLFGEQKLILSDGASLNIELNDGNKYDSISDTPVFNQGATQFIANGVNTSSSGMMRFIIDNAIQDKYYLGALGNFEAMNEAGMIISQVNNGEGTANIVKEKLGSAVWLDIEKGIYLVSRKANGVTTQNEVNYFNDVFESGGSDEKAFATNDVIYLAGDIDATDEVYTNANITAFAVVSNAADSVRKITATGDNSFFSITGDTIITLDNVVFFGGGSDDPVDDGGAIWASGNNSTLTLRSLNNQVTFQNNSANCGGAIEANTLVLEGKHSFVDNNAQKDGGAIWAQNVTFNGNNSKAIFSDNTATGKGADIFIDGHDGSLTFNDNGIYSFGSGIYVQGTTNINDSAQVTFGANSFNTIQRMMTINSQQNEMFAKGATLNFNGGLTLGNGVNQKFEGAAITLDSTLGVTYGGDPNTFNSKADLTNATSLSIVDGTKFVIYDTNGKEMSAKDFSGKVLGTSHLVIGPDNSAELQKIVPDDFNYESLLYSVRLETGTDIILKSVEKSVEPQTLSGNVASAVKLFHKGAILDVQTAEQARVLTNGATGELFVSSAQVQTDRLNYLNRLIIARSAENSMMNRAERTVRGQTANCPVPSIFSSSSCSANHLNKTNLWASGYYISGETQTSGNINGQSYSCSGMLTGADWTIDSGNFGLFYGYGETGLDATASNLESKDHTFGIWSRWNSALGPGYTSVLGDFSFCDGEGRRFFQDNVWQSHYNAWQGSVYLERGLEFEANHWNLNPYFALQYVGFSADPSADAQLQFSAIETDSLRTILGLRIDRDFCLRGRNANISSGFAWDHELLNTDLVFTAERIGGGTVAPILGNNAGHDWFEYNTGLAIDWSEGLTVSANYYLFLNKYTALNAGMGTVTFRY